LVPALNHFSLEFLLFDKVKKPNRMRKSNLHLMNRGDKVAVFSMGKSCRGGGANLITGNGIFSLIPEELFLLLKFSTRVLLFVLLLQENFI
jgi:hypothetical protein